MLANDSVSVSVPAATVCGGQQEIEGLAEQLTDLRQRHGVGEFAMKAEANAPLLSRATVHGQYHGFMDYLRALSQQSGHLRSLRKGPNKGCW